MQKKIQQFFLEYGLPIVLSLSFLVWIFLFREFLFHKLMLIGDAKIYQEHIKFYLDNVRHGIYPMWEHNRNFGVPTEFFLRRIGEFNPFLYLVVILNLIGISYTPAYLIFLAIYYFIGSIGFFLIAKLILRNTTMALLAYFILLFSSLGTRLFDSFLIYIFTPMVWFFFFLIAFLHNMEKRYLLGVVFTAMILVTTYIPFYFITVFLYFLTCLMILYPKELKPTFLRFKKFCAGHKAFAFFCIIIFCIALVPGILLYQSGSDDTITMPQRNYEAPTAHLGQEFKNTFSVNIGKSHRGGIVILKLLEELVASLRDFHLGTLYIPGFIFLMLLLGLITKFDRKGGALILFGGGLFILGLGKATFIYKFLYNYVFYFKFFRNLQFFLWLVLLPTFILLVVRQFQAFLSFQPQSNIQKKLLAAFIVIVHAGLAMFLFYEIEGVIFSSYLIILLSGLFLLFYFFNHSFHLKITNNPFLFIIILFFIVIIQPVEVYHYLNQNSIERTAQYPYRYDRKYHRLLLPTEADVRELRGQQFLTESEDTVSFTSKKSRRMWLGIKWTNFLIRAINPHVLEQYLLSPLLVYDHVQWVHQKDINLDLVSDAFQRNQNLVFVASDKTTSIPNLDFKNHSPYVEAVTHDSNNVKVLEFSTNFIKLETEYSSPKFLVYNDSYHHNWKAFINDKEVDLYRANLAFKGVWIPSGKNIVYFRYGKSWKYFLSYGIISLFLFIFVYLITIFRKSLTLSNLKAYDE